jgi:hypothetical protein
MVASYIGATDADTDSDAGGVAQEPAKLLNNKTSRANCGPMTQQGMMGAHGHEMHPQGFLRLVGCHETSCQREDAAPRLHA